MSRPYPNPTATARFNLVRRLERFFAAHVDPAEKLLSGAQLANLAAAIEALHDGRYGDGEDAAMLAEKNWPARHLAGGRTPRQIADLMAEFERMKAG